ncbi:MAG: polyprenol monophosphomannose synthase [Planctomycetaceae bacterium]|jgi:dolichol-phosphate mannosyltransferase|nr:polyprenol monophosphomannose synthase [Planctomycetaceae bacterium]
MSSRFIISLATYNERENLPILAAQIFESAPDVDILVIDDSSPDGTADWVEETMQHDSRFKLIKRSSKQGIGSAVLAAIDYAIYNGYDFLINMDADLSHPPRFLPMMRSKAEEGFDVVIGSRYVSGGSVEGWAWYRRWMSRGINFYARCLLGLKTQDNSGSFRCYRTSLLKQLKPNGIISRGYSFFEEILYRIRKLGGTFAEVPITFEERRKGQSKLNVKEIIIALWLILRIGMFRG